MKTNPRDIPLQIKMLSNFEENKKYIFKNDTPYIRKLRNKAFNNFKRLGFPDTKLENWRYTDLTDKLSLEYNQYFKAFNNNFNIEDIFSCKVSNMNTYMITQVNGWVNYKNKALITLPNGMIVGSLFKAKTEYPELIEKHFGRYSNIDDGLNALNTAFAQDGLFIYVPDNVKVLKPIQIVNIINSDENIFVQPRHLVIMGKNSNLTLIHCDYSIKHKKSFTNSLSEIFIDKNAFVDYYKIQNKDNDSTLIASTYFHQEANSHLLANTITLNGGLVRDNIHVKLNGQGSESNLYGLYLVDGKQHFDNQTYIEHVVPNCYSNELYKGILDDEAKAVFNGYILVRKNAQKTNAFQSNKNILLKDTAKINTMPHLEIYADDVKCSHGAAIGQLDPEAMFYLRSRGIEENCARMMLMYAFTLEIINNISIDAIRERIEDLVSKRLKGQLTACNFVF